MIIKEYFLKYGCFIDNDFLQKYIDIINDAIYNVPCEYIQIHHIIPVMVFKKYNEPVDNSDGNLVKLTYTNHALAHYYLYLCTNSDIKYKNLYAMQFITGRYGISDKDIIENEKELNELYTNRQKLLSENNSMKNKVHLDRHNSIMRSEEVRNKISNTMRQVRLNTDDVLIYKGHDGKRVLRSELATYLSNGWIVGNKQSQFIRINKDGKKKTIFEDEWDVYEKDGWKMGNLQKLSDKHLNALRASHFKTVCVYDTNNILLNRFCSVRDAAEWWYTNIDLFPIGRDINEFNYKYFAGLIKKSHTDKRFYGNIRFSYENGGDNCDKVSSSD